MTDTEPTPAAPAAPAAPSKRSPGVVAAIVIVVVVVLVGGAFVVYKLTKSKDQPTPFLKVAKETVAAIKAGDSSQLRSLSSGQGTTQLLALKPNDANGFTVTAASCKPFPQSVPTRVCVVSRPGGQLQLRLVFRNNAWKVDLAEYGPAATTPIGGGSTTPTT